MTILSGIPGALADPNARRGGNSDQIQQNRIDGCHDAFSNNQPPQQAHQSRPAQKKADTRVSRAEYDELSEELRRTKEELGETRAALARASGHLTAYKAIALSHYATIYSLMVEVAQLDANNLLLTATQERKASGGYKTHLDVNWQSYFNQATTKLFASSRDPNKNEYIEEVLRQNSKFL